MQIVPKSVISTKIIAAPKIAKIGATRKITKTSATHDRKNTCQNRCYR